MRAGRRAMKAEEELLKMAAQLKATAQELIKTATIHEAMSEDLKEIAESRIEEGDE